MTAIITCGQTRQSLSATRALGRAGIPVAVGAPFRPCLSMWSRFATSTFLTKDPKTHPQLFASQMAQELSGRYACCVLVGTDEAYWALSRFRDKLSVSARRLLPPHASIARALDFQALHDFAESLGIPCCKMLQIAPETTPLEAEAILSKLSFPLIIRAIVPWRERADGSRKLPKKRVLLDLDALSEALEENSLPLKHGFLVESREMGRPISCVAFCDRGQILASGFQERLREEEALSEVATLVRTIEPIPELFIESQRLLKALQWQGPAKVEFVQGTDGVYRLVSLLGRLWGSAQLSVFAGFNIPLMSYRLAEGTLTSDLLTDMRPNVQMRWLMGDAYAVSKKILSSMTHPWQLPKTLWSLKQKFGAQRPHKLRRYIDVFDPQDPMPFLFELQEVTWKPVIKEGTRRISGPG